MKPNQAAAPSAFNPLLAMASAGVLLRVQPLAAAHVLLSRAPAPLPPPTPLARLRQLCSRNAWFLFALSALFCVAQASAAAAPGAIDSSSDHSSSKDWYIVLVSIPVLDKVLPLKHLAEELLHRGYRVGFALPEVRLSVRLSGHLVACPTKYG